MAELAAEMAPREATAGLFRRAPRGPRADRPRQRTWAACPSGFSSSRDSAPAAPRGLGRKAPDSSFDLYKEKPTGLPVTITYLHLRTRSPPGPPWRRPSWSSPGLPGQQPRPSSPSRRQPLAPGRVPECCSGGRAVRAAGWACGRVPPGTSSPSRARTRAESVGSREGRALGAERNGAA